MSDLPDSPRRYRSPETGHASEPVSTEQIAELLNDVYTRRILEEIRDGPEPARALAEACDASRPTVYRRLNALSEAGLVRSTMQYHPDGHHREVFETDVEAVTVSLDADGFAAEVHTRDGSTGARSGEPSSPGQTGAAD